MALDAAYEKLLERLEGFTVHDEDGQPRLFRGLPGLTVEEIAAWERKSGFKLPEDYKRFIMSWDGAEAGEFEILPHSTSIAIETGMLPLHVWGNGDVDCMDLKPANYGAVVFLNRESNSRPVIAPNFALWLAGVIRELDYHGMLFHPFLDERPGFYRKALGRGAQKTIVRLEEPGNFVYWICRKIFGFRHGTLTWRHKSGGKKRETIYRFNKLKKETCWHENGEKLSETFYISEDSAHGPQTSWHPNGKTKTRREFVKGHLEGRESAWNEQGQLVSEKVWKWSRLVSETFFNRFTNTIEETIYGDKDGERVVSETRTRKLSSEKPSEPGDRAS